MVREMAKFNKGTFIVLKHVTSHADHISSYLTLLVKDVQSV